MTKYLVALVVLVLLGAYSVLTAVFCAWLTATPLTPHGLETAQRDFFIWFAASILILALSVATIIRMIHLRRTRRTVDVTSSV